MLEFYKKSLRYYPGKRLEDSVKSNVNYRVLAQEALERNTIRKWDMDKSYHNLARSLAA